jgi:flagellar protein FliO/FliZ
MRWIACLFLILASQARALEVQSLRVVDSSDRVTAFITVDGDLANEIPPLEFINETIQFDIPSATVKGGEIVQRVKDAKVKSLYAYQLDPDTARVRIILNPGVKADSIKDNLKLDIGSQGFEARIEKPASKRQPSTVTASFKPQSMVDEPKRKTEPTEFDNLTDNEIEQQLKALPTKVEVAPTAAAVTVVPTPSAPQPTQQAIATTKTPEVKAEEDTPVFTEASKKQPKASGVSMAKSILGLAIVAILLLTMYWGTQKWLAKRNEKNPHTNIRVLTTHYLGPKKSLSIISVAGESILIGVTDHNINLIKSLSLLDGEIPAQVPENFQSSLEEAEAQEHTEDDYAVKGIKEIVAGRLKGMRDLL